MSYSSDPNVEALCRLVSIFSGGLLRGKLPPPLDSSDKLVNPWIKDTPRFRHSTTEDMDLSVAAGVGLPASTPGILLAERYWTKIVKSPRSSTKNMAGLLFGAEGRSIRLSDCMRAGTHAELAAKMGFGTAPAMIMLGRTLHRFRHGDHKETFTTEVQAELDKEDAKRFVRPSRYKCAASGCPVEASKGSMLRACAGKCEDAYKPRYCTKECQVASKNPIFKTTRNGEYSVDIDGINVHTSLSQLSALGFKELAQKVSYKSNVTEYVTTVNFGSFMANFHPGGGVPPLSGREKYKRTRGIGEYQSSGQKADWTKKQYQDELWSPMHQFSSMAWAQSSDLNGSVDVLDTSRTFADLAGERTKSVPAERPRFWAQDAAFNTRGCFGGPIPLLVVTKRCLQFEVETHSIRRRIWSYGGGKQQPERGVADPVVGNESNNPEENGSSQRHTREAAIDNNNEPWRCPRRRPSLAALPPHLDVAQRLRSSGYFSRSTPHGNLRASRALPAYEEQATIVTMESDIARSDYDHYRQAVDAEALLPACDAGLCASVR
ncbi:hypothetical protein B0H14DRAFT_2634844 [Mycena olivaceomarginata]|nr:hypothetical protein B0H14DRAFT_2634844 [Mycena olivaceomarginata]